MPVANIHVLTGHPRAVLKQLLREASAAFASAIDAPPERLQVWITEVDPELYAIAGEPADEVLQRVPRGEAEIPLIRMALMEGRPVAMLHRAMADLSAVVARVLGGDPRRVRVQIDHVHPDRWAIGGVPASSARGGAGSARRVLTSADHAAMTPEQIQTCGDELYDAWRARRVVAPLLERFPGITVEHAYAIQQRMVGQRVQAGERIVGKKIGVTSKPVQDLLGVYEPDFGQLTSGMVCTESDGVDLAAMIQPKAEAELAFVLERDLVGPGITATDVLRATAYVTPCFEIVDSRIRDWKIKIQDTVADNASCGVFLLGAAKGNPRTLDLTLAGMVLYKNDQLFSTSAGAAVQGSPVNAVVWLANTLGRLGLPFKAGEVILSGSQSQLLPVVEGDELVCTIGGLGQCRARFHGKAAA